MRRCSLDMTVANSPTAPAKISFLLEALEELGLAVGGDEESPPGEGGCCLITSKRCIKDSVLGLISKSPPDSGEAAFGGPATVGIGLGLGADMAVVTASVPDGWIPTSSHCLQTSIALDHLANLSRGVP